MVISRVSQWEHIAFIEMTISICKTMPLLRLKIDMEIRIATGCLCVCIRACVVHTVQYSPRECVDNLISKRVRPFIINYLYGCQFSLVDGLFSCNFCIESATCIYALYAFCSVTAIGYVQIFLLSSNCLSQFVLLLLIFFLFIFSIQLFRKTNALCNGNDRKNWLMYAWLNWRPMFHKPIAPVQIHYLFLWTRCTFQFRHIIHKCVFLQALADFLLSIHDHHSFQIRW